MNEQKNIELVQKGYQAFGSGNIPTLLDLFDTNIEWRSPHFEGSPFKGSYNGREAVGEFFQKLGEVEEFSLFEPREFIAQGDKVVVLGAFAATVKTTGRNYQSDWIHIFNVRDGKVTNFFEMFDTAAAQKAFQKAASA
jgi:uncharacterized protein